MRMQEDEKINEIVHTHSKAPAILSLKLNYFLEFVISELRVLNSHDNVVTNLNINIYGH
jgi:hypothetical protein